MKASAAMDHQAHWVSAISLSKLSCSVAALQQDLQAAQSECSGARREAAEALKERCGVSTSASSQAAAVVLQRCVVLTRRQAVAGTVCRLGLQNHSVASKSLSSSLKS